MQITHISLSINCKALSTMNFLIDSKVISFNVSCIFITITLYFNIQAGKLHFNNYIPEKNIFSTDQAKGLKFLFLLYL